MSKRSRINLLAVFAVIVLTGGCASPGEKAARFMKTGIKLAEAKDHARAILEFRNAAKLAPKDPEPYYRMALSQMATENLAQAVTSLRKAAGLDPKHVKAQMKLAEILLASRQPKLIEQAQERLKKALAAAPDNVDIIRMQASAALALGNLDESEGLAREVLTKAPRDTKAHVMLALVKIGRKDMDGAEQTLKESVEKNPQAADALVGLGKFYLLRGKTHEAEQQFQRALQVDPKYVPALMNLASQQVGLGQKEQAEETLRRLATLPDPKYKLPHTAILAELGKPEAALAELETLFKEFPKDRDVRSRLVKAYIDLGRVSDGQKILNAALAANSQDVDAIAQRAELNLNAGKLTEAQNDVASWLKYRPESGEAHYLMAQLHRRQGSVSNQKQELSEALRRNPGLLPARLEMAQLLIDSKGAKTALELIDAAPESQKGTLPAIIQRNRALLALNDLAGARSGIDAGLAQAKAPELLLQDGLLRLRQQDKAGARSSLEQALKQAPDDVRILDALAGSYVMEKQPGKALALVREHAAQRPRSARVQHYLAQLLIETGDKAGVRAALMAAKAADPTLPEVDLDLARLDMSEGKLDSARQILIAYPKNARAVLTLSMLEEKAGNFPEAIAQYRKTLELDGQNVVALNNLAFRLAEHTGQIDEALKYAQRARELAPESMSAADDTLGWIYYKKGVYRTAVRYLESALAKQVTAQRKYHLAMAYQKAGDGKLARQTLHTALQMDATLPEAREAQELMGGQ